MMYFWAVNADQFGHAWVGAKRIEPPPDREIFQHDVHDRRDTQHDDGRQRHVTGDRKICDIRKCIRHEAGDLLAIAVPVGDSKCEGAGGQRRDEGVDLGGCDQKSVDESDYAAKRDGEKNGERPGQMAVRLESDHEHFRDAEHEADREIILPRGEGRHHRQGQERDDGLRPEDGANVERRRERSRQQQ